MLAIVGLGNPGGAYANNRHNVGFRVVDAFRTRYRLPGFERAGASEVCRGRFRGRSVVLAKPQTYMNRSGEAVRALVRAERLELDEILVVVDDVYLPLGRLRLRATGGDGGHNGIGSIIEAVGTEGFPRLRVGVGAPERTADLAEHVLDDFGPGEEAVIGETVTTAVEALATFLGRGIEAAMNRFNVAGGEAGESARPAPGP